jgi:hypothetical protein
LPPGGVSEPGSGPRRRTGVGLGRSVGRDSPQKVEHMAVGPAGPQPLGKGWPVRLSAGSASACSAATDERSGQPARTPLRQPVLRRIMPTSAGFASAMPPSSDRGRPRSRGPRWWLRIGSGAHPAPPAQGRLCRRRPEPIPAVAGHRVEHFPARGRGGDVALSPSPPPSVIRLRAWASTEAAGVARAAWPRSFRRSRRSSRHQAVAKRPAKSPGRSRPLPRRSSEPRSPSCHQVWELYPAMGTVRTLNWTLNAESRPQRERIAVKSRDVV